MRRSLALELVDCAATLGDPAIAFWAHNGLAHSLIEHGDLTSAREAAEHATRAWQISAGQPALLWFNCFQLAALELLHGDLAAAERLGEQAFQLGREAGQPDAVLCYGAQITFIRTYQGRGGEIIETFRGSAGAWAGVPSFGADLARTLCFLDLHDEARGILEQAASDGFEHVGSK